MALVCVRLFRLVYGTVGTGQHRNGAAADSRASATAPCDVFKNSKKGIKSQKEHLKYIGVNPGKLEFVNQRVIQYRLSK